MRADGSQVRQVSSGKGVTTCAFIAPDNRSIIYASTHLQQDQCPPKPDYSQGYVWPLHDSYDIFTAGPNGENPQPLTKSDGYDAEAVYSPKGDRIVFTSLRSGDLELYLMNPDGSGVEQLTDQPGYDGGAFFSLDGEWIVWRASRPTGKALADYRALLADGLIRPGELELFIMKLSERKPIQITDNGAANFGPYWHPDGEHIIFSSNMDDPEGPQLRSLPGQHRDPRNRARHHLRRLRRLPDVLPRRQDPGVRLQPFRQGERRDQRLYRRVEMKYEAFTEDRAAAHISTLSRALVIMANRYNT